MLAPETAASPIAEAPADRPTAQLEDLLRQVSAIIFADRVLDKNERTVLYNWMADVASKSGMGNGVGNGPVDPAMQAQQGMSPMDMNQNTEDYGTADGAEPAGEDQGGY